jgi:hypothetical protein
MKFLNICISAFFLVSVSAGVASAQDSDSSDKYHPFLSDNFNIGLGIYRPSQKRSLGADLDLGASPGESLDVSESQTTGLLNFRWRFTKNWSFQGTYWATDSDSEKILTEDFEGLGEVFLAGSFITSGIDTSITRLFWGRSFFRKPSTDWGVGLGLHVLDIDAVVAGQIDTVGGGTEFHTERASVTAPLPNLGIWYMYSWSPKWVVSTRLDWLDLTVEEFSGSMYDLSVGVNYQMSDHFGIGLAVNAFRLNVEVDDPDWGSGGLVNEQIGPRLNVTWNW